MDGQWNRQRCLHRGGSGTGRERRSFGKSTIENPGASLTAADVVEKIKK
jgi:hypothetical protein